MSILSSIGKGILNNLPVVGDVANSISQGIQNRKDRKFTKEMYEKQKKDNIEFWNMQNSYNSPQEQMKRLQAAGLNPNLVYGDGATGNVASAPDSVQPKEFSQTAPSLENPINSYFNLKAQQAQLNNLQLQNDLLAQKKLMNDIDYDLPTYSNNVGKDFVDADGALVKTPLGRRADKLANDSEKSDWQKRIAKIEYELKQGTLDTSIKTIVQKLKNLEAGEKNTKAETDVKVNQAQLQEFEKKLNEAGIDRNSPYYIKIIAHWAQKLGLIKF